MKNISISTITVGHMPVAPGDSITIGTFSNRGNHDGIWYNIEGYNRVNSTSYGLLTGATAGELTTINNVINSNNTWTVTKNCSYFAKTVWNATNSGITLSGTNPYTLANSIKSKDGYITNPTIPTKDKSSIARHTSTGYVYDSSGATRV